MLAMAFDPEPATPHTEIISDEIAQPENPKFVENVEMSTPDAEVWRGRGEPLASALSDAEAGREQGWDEPSRNEPVHIAPEVGIWEPQRELAAPQHAWLMPKSERQGAGGPWYQIRLAQLHDNHRVIGQSAALISVGAIAALLAVGFSHRRSPLPDGLRGTGGLRQETPLVKSRRKLPARLAAKRVGKSPVVPKKAVELKSPKPAARAQIMPGKVNLAASHEVLSNSRERSGMDTKEGFVANDTVTHYSSHHPAIAPPK